MSYFYNIHSVPTEALIKIIEEIRLVIAEQISQQSNAIFVTMKTLDCVEDQEVKHKRIWIYYVILKWGVCYCNKNYKDLPRGVLREFSQIFNDYLNDNDDDEFIKRVTNLNTAVMV